MKSKIKQAIVAGFPATIVMTIIMAIAPMMGMPKMSIGNMLAGFTGMPSWIGWVMHFMIGIMWALVFVFLLRDKIPGSAAVKGMLFALIPWLLMQLMVIPMMGMGVFFSQSPDQGMMIAGTLIVHLMYGITLGVIARSEDKSVSLPLGHG